MKKLCFVVPITAALLLYCVPCYAIDIMAGSLRLKRPVQSVKEIRGKHVIKQSLDYSCGPAGLATIMNYYFGDTMSEKDIINYLLRYTSLAKVKQRKGFSLLDLKKFLEARGYKTAGYKMDIEFLKELDQPVLVPIKFKNFRHFVVVKGILADRVFVADPTLGNMSMKVNWFKNIWENGVGLVIEDKEAGQRDPFMPHKTALLKVKMRDAVFADYRQMNRIVQNTAIMTTVHPKEW